MMKLRTTSTMMTTAIGMAAVAGTAAYMLSSNKDIRYRTKRLRRSAGRALRQIGGYIENISEVLH